MIEFKIISTPDRSQIASYQHLGAEFSLGKSEGDMIVDDPHLAPLQLRVRVFGGQASIENTEPSVELRLNGKAVEGEAPLKERDSISVGKTSIQFTRLDLSPPTPPPAVEYRNAAARFTPDSKETAVLNALELLERQSEETSGAIGQAPAVKPPLPPVPGSKPPIPKMPPLPPKKG